MTFYTDSVNFCASYKVFFIGLRRSLETIVSKKGYLPGDKRFWPIFPRFMECDKTQETIYKGPQAIVTITVELIGACF